MFFQSYFIKNNVCWIFDGIEGDLRHECFGFVLRNV